MGDGEIDGAHPEALTYEPRGDGYRLVGVEYIVDAATWMAHPNAPQVLEGPRLSTREQPQSVWLAPFFELHVWAWRNNPNGAFVDWNTHVSCEGQ